MRYRKLDSDGDYSFGHQLGDFYINTPDAVRQAVLTRLNLWVGDWFLDLTEGMNWRAKVLGRYQNRNWDPEIRRRILGTQGVTQIVEYYSTLDSVARRLNVAARVDTIYSVGAAPVSFTATLAPTAPLNLQAFGFLES